MVGQKYEIGLKRLPVALLRLIAEELPEIALGGVVSRLGLNWFFAGAEPKEGGQNTGKTSGEGNRLIEIRRFVEVLVIDCSEGTQSSAKGIHRGRVGGEQSKHVNDRFGEFAVLFHPGLEIG